MTISETTPNNVIIHPLVLLSVVDHYNRVAKNTKKRVVGVLLGQWNPDNTVNVANSYAIPFEEDERDPSVWYLDHNYHESMYEMFKKVNAREKVVGWYHSGPKLRASDLEINELFKKFIPKPVLVVIDVKPKDLEIPTEAYYAVEEVHDDGTETTQTFIHVPSSIEAEEAEEIGVEHLLRDIKDNNVGNLSTKISSQLNSLRSLQLRLESIRDYLQKVVSGQLPVNHQIIYNLQDIFNALPNLDVPQLVKSFNIKTNDELFAIYISSLIRSIIALHELIDNKIMLKKVENNEDEPKAENNTADADKDKAEAASTSDNKEKPENK